jgi:hypothetical protein
MKTMNKILTVAALMLVALTTNAQEVEKEKPTAVKEASGKPRPMQKKAYAKKDVRRANAVKNHMKAAPKKEE